MTGRSSRAAPRTTSRISSAPFARASRRLGPDVVLCMTDPPFIGAAAQIVARRFRVPLVVVSQDVFPEIAVRLGRLRNPVVIGAAARAHRLCRFGTPTGSS